MSEKLNSQARMLKIAEYLCKNHYAGSTNKQIAKAVGTSEVNISRDIAIFIKEGWALRDDDLLVRMSPSFGGLAGQIMKSYQGAKLRLTEEEASYASAMQ